MFFWGIRNPVADASTREPFSTCVPRGSKVTQDAQLMPLRVAGRAAAARRHRLTASARVAGWGAGNQFGLAAGWACPLRRTYSCIWAPSLTGTSLVSRYASLRIKSPSFFTP